MRCLNCGLALDLDYGEECEYCGAIAGSWDRLPKTPKREVLYFYQSKHDLNKKGEGIWRKCANEQSCRVMGEQGFRVKKIVKEIVEVVDENASIST